jgi:hypothetical protein
MGLILPHTFTAKTRAKASEVNDNFDAVKAALNTNNPGEIIVANSSGVPKPVPMSGDVTINGTGVTTIGNGKVTAAKLADGAVTTAKLTASYEQDHDTGNLSASFSTLSSVSLAAGTWVVSANIDLAVTGGTAGGANTRISVAGLPLKNKNRFLQPLDVYTVVYNYIWVLTSTQTVALQAERTNSQTTPYDSSITAHRIG